MVLKTKEQAAKTEQPKVCSLMGHENVNCVLTAGQGVKVLELKISQDRLGEFQTALNRALNTWDSPPEWLMEITDMLEIARTK